MIPLGANSRRPHSFESSLLTFTFSVRNIFINFVSAGDLRAPICLVCCNKIDGHSNQIIAAAVAYIAGHYRQIDWAVEKRENKIKLCRVSLFVFISFVCDDIPTGIVGHLPLGDLTWTWWTGFVTIVGTSGGDTPNEINLFVYAATGEVQWHFVL